MTFAQYVVTFWILILGAAIGSFLNVCIYRLPRGLSVLHPSRSFCPRCEHFIEWFDNVPVLSFLNLGARCRYCRARISWQYPAVEALTAVLFTLTWVKLHYVDRAPLGPSIVYLELVALLIVGSGTDFEFRIITEEVTLFGMLTGLLASTMMPEMHVGPLPWQTFRSLTGIAPLDGFLASLIGALVSGGVVLFFLFVGRWVFKKEAMGMGDVVLMAMVGTFVGWKLGFVAFFVAPFMGILYGIAMMFSTGDHYMPYGPWLAMASLICLYFRDWFAHHFNTYIDIITSLVKLIF